MVAVLSFNSNEEESCVFKSARAVSYLIEHTPIKGMSKSRSPSVESSSSSSSISSSSSSDQEKKGKLGRSIVKMVLDRKKGEASKKRERELEADLVLSDKSDGKMSQNRRDWADEVLEEDKQEPQTSGTANLQHMSKTDQLIELLARRNLEEMDRNLHRSKRSRHDLEDRAGAYFERPENVERMPLGSRTYPHPLDVYFEEVNKVDVMRIHRNEGSQRQEDKRKQRTVDWKKLSAGFKATKQVPLSVMIRGPARDAVLHGDLELGMAKQLAAFRELKSRTVYTADEVYSIGKALKSLKPEKKHQSSFSDFLNPSDYFKKDVVSSVEIPPELQEGASLHQVNATIEQANKAIQQLQQQKMAMKNNFDMFRSAYEDANQAFGQNSDWAKASVYPVIQPLAKRVAKVEDYLSLQKKEISSAQKRAGDMGSMILNLQKGFAHTKKWCMSWQSRPHSIGSLADYLRFVEGKADPGESVRRRTEMYEKERTRIVREGRGDVMERRKSFGQARFYRKNESFQPDRPGRPFTNPNKGKFTPKAKPKNFNLRCFDCNLPGYTTQTCPNCNSQIRKSGK